MNQEYKYSKEEIDEIKEKLTIEQISDLVAELGGSPQMANGYFTAHTICHNPAGEGSHKLYYYDNTKLFRCYTSCAETFDIFDLVEKHMNVIGEKKKYYSKDGILKTRKWEIFDAIEFVLIYFNLSSEIQKFKDFNINSDDWKYLDQISTNKLEKSINEKIVELKKYDDKIIKNLPRPIIEPWAKEGITKEVMDIHNICFDSGSYSIVIPHYDKDNNLIGIRQRTLIKENEIYGKYRPAIFSGVMYNHPLGFNLYNLNHSKDNIKQLEKAIVFEGEKSCLLYGSLFGMENDISVATCGFNILNYQVELLVEAGAKEIIIAFDKQFKQLGDDEWKKLVEKLYAIHHKFGHSVQVSYIFDTENLLDYKDSPIDKGKDIFVKLAENRICITKEAKWSLNL